MHRDSDIADDTHRRATDGARILVIEDNDDLRLLMELVLRDEGYLVESAASAEDGLRLLERGTYRLILSDYTLPGNTGLWLLSEAVERKLLHGAATRLVTGDPDAPGLSERTDVIPKPVDFEAFLPQIRAVVASVLAPREAPAAERESTHAVELVLYVSEASIACTRAERAMRDLLNRYGDRVLFTVCDVAREPAQAAADHVIFTPSLVKRYPPPRLWIVGDLRHPRVVADVLAFCGVSAVADGV
jgi:DNA-binding response OmpR family regulator